VCICLYACMHVCMYVCVNVFDWCCWLRWQAPQVLEYVYHVGLPCTGGSRPPNALLYEEASYCVLDLCKYCSEKLHKAPITAFQRLDLSSLPPHCVSAGVASLH
jgi:hypothetical protein